MSLKSKIIAFLSTTVLLVQSTIIFADTEDPDNGDGSSGLWEANSFVETIDYNLVDPGKFSETIDEYSGSLAISHTDLFIPGEGGLDLSIIRNYTPPGSRFDDIRLGPARLGDGWNIHLGYIERGVRWWEQAGAVDWSSISGTNEADNIKLCKFGSYSERDDADWSNSRLVTADGNGGQLFNSTDSSYSFLTTSGWRGGCSNVGFIMYSPEGLKYRFDIVKTVIRDGFYGGNPEASKDVWVPTRIEDQFGNWIQISYRSESDLMINQITTSDGRTVDFNYSDVSGELKLTSIVSDTRTISYHYDSAGFLTEVGEAGRTLWKYAYESDKHALNRLETESGGVFQYIYGENRKYHFPSRAVYQRIVSGTLPSSTTTYEDVTSSSGWTSAYAIKVVEHDRCSINTYHNWLGTYGDISQTTLWRDAKPLSNERYANSTCTGDPVEVVSYSYEKLTDFTDQIIRRGTPPTASDLDPTVSGPVSMAVLKSKSIERDGVKYIQEHSNFTMFGQPENTVDYSIESSSESVLASKTTTRTYAATAYNKPLEPLLSSTVTDTNTGSVASTQVNTYNSNYQLASQTANGIKTSYTYHSNGNLATTEDARNNVVNFSNYYRGKARTVADSIGTSTSTYNYFGLVLSSTTAEGNVTSYTYNADQRVKNITPPMGDSINYTYDATGYEVGYGNYWVRTSLDGLNRSTLVHEKDLSTNTSRYSQTQYDAYGRVVFQSIPHSSSTTSLGTTTEYDPLGRTTRVKTPVGDSYFDYSEIGKVKITNALGFVSYNYFEAYSAPSYDNIVRIESPSSSGTIVTQIERDVAGRLKSVIQGDGSNSDIHHIDYSYNGSYLDLPESIAYPAFTYHYTYDAVGNVKTIKVGGGSTTTYTYDTRNRLTKTDYPAGTDDVTLTYTKTNKIKTAVNGIGDWTVNYNSSDLIESRTVTTGPKTFDFQYHYDNQLNLSSMTYPGSGIVVDYAPNGFGEATKAGTYASGVAHHAQGSMKSLVYGNGITYSLGLHSNGVSLGSIKATAGSSTYIDKTYDFDAHGNATSIVDAIKPEYSVSGFQYDGVDRLLAATSTAWGGEVTVAYDRLGNITQKNWPDREMGYQYDDINQLVGVDVNVLKPLWVLISVGGIDTPIPVGPQSGTRNFVYDYRGNVIDNGDVQFDFNEANQIVRGDVGSNYQTYKNDAFGKRIQVLDSDGTVVSYELYDLADRLLYTEDNSGNKNNKIYLGNKLVAQDYNGTKKYIHFDLLGSTIGVSDDSNNVVYEHYFPFGQKVEDPSGTQIDQWYTGKKYDEFVELSYHGARYYDPEIGRFYSDDPLGYRGIYSFNRYMYANNNPYKYIDPDGKDGIQRDNIIFIGGTNGGRQAIKGKDRNETSSSKSSSKSSSAQKGKSCFGQMCRSAGNTSNNHVAGATDDFLDNYNDMRDANTIGADKYFHCKANCEASQRGLIGERTAETISDSREWVDQNIKGDPLSASQADQKANIYGRQQGSSNPQGSCKSLCSPFRPNGLDQKY